ncbi:putative pla2g4b [Durotheca rogersii]|uniref:putative pla2g4b n=1 Tax=Durotheca rogersii TaxID=419775 RepID=UPI00221F9BF3|nr:putative pla2g4b [Durotheca rogersii]KAI5859483.1 putative pla2g4b [Durotheca rogersii]
MAPDDDPVAELITAFAELNSGAVEELDGEPGPLEFMRFVARNTPFVARGAAADWPAARRWTAAYLREQLAGHRVNVAVTPGGRADAPEPAPGGFVFAQPHEEEQPFGAFLAHVVAQEQGGEAAAAAAREVWYAQTQNDNLRGEYATLAAQVPPSVPFARVALRRAPDAVNLWIGNSRSVTALHRDNYENLYVQVAGRKHFVLLPALCQPCVNERRLPPAVYVREPDGALRLRAQPDADCVPFPLWDPDEPDVLATKYSHLARPLRVTLEPGDMLYLPAMWYHKVSQSCSEEGICVAVNYWYDMEFSGPLYPLVELVRRLGHATAAASTTPMTAAAME